MKDNKQQTKVSADDRFRKGLWSVEEDKMLLDYVDTHGKGHWNSVSRKTGLKRSGKSCRLRWMNYLSPSVKRERFTEDEEDLIIRLHRLLGNRWALIAGRVPGRTDNQVKNHWNTHLSKKIISNRIPYAPPPTHPKPATSHNDKQKSCSCNHNHITVADAQTISSDFSSNTACGTKGSSVIPAETVNKEGKESQTNMQKITQPVTQQANKACEVEPIEPDENNGDGDHGSCFMQYLDDYTLHFVLSNNHRSIAPASVGGV